MISYKKINFGFLKIDSAEMLIDYKFILISKRKLVNNFYLWFYYWIKEQIEILYYFILLISTKIGNLDDKEHQK